NLFPYTTLFRSRTGRGGLSIFSGGFGEGETPLPIPNRAVKPLSADGTWPARTWESRTPPVFCERGRPRAARRISCCSRAECDEALTAATIAEASRNGCSISGASTRARAGREVTRHRSRARLGVPTVAIPQSVRARRGGAS